jgi:hypothetical protein
MSEINVELPVELYVEEFGIEVEIMLQVEADYCREHGEYGIEHHLFNSTVLGATLGDTDFPMSRDVEWPTGAKAWRKGTVTEYVATLPIDDLTLERFQNHGQS